MENRGNNGERNTGMSWRITTGLLAPLFFFVLIFVLGALEPGFNHKASLMSRLGGVPGIRGIAFDIGVVLAGVLIIAFASGLRPQLPSGTASKIGIYLLAIGGLSLVVTGAFPCKPECRNILVEPDFIGRVHLIASFISGVGLAWSPVAIGIAFRNDERWRNWWRPTLAVAVLSNIPGIVLWITLLTGARLHSIEGLLQRSAILVVFVWIFALALKLSMQRFKRTSV